MNLAMSQEELVNLIVLHSVSQQEPKEIVRHFPLRAILRMHFLQQWFGLSYSAQERAAALARIIHTFPSNIFLDRM
jgi:hypothetical protein